MNIAAEDKCLEEFENLKYRKIEARYIQFVISNQKIAIEKIGDKKQTWNDFVNALPSNQLRYAVFDFQFKKHDGMEVSKLIFVTWNPDSSPLKKRILYATAKQNFKKFLDLNSKDFTLGAPGDVTEEDIIKELSK